MSIGKFASLRNVDLNSLRYYEKNRRIEACLLRPVVRLPLLHSRPACLARRHIFCQVFGHAAKSVFKLHTVRLGF